MIWDLLVEYSLNSYVPPLLMTLNGGHGAPLQKSGASSPCVSELDSVTLADAATTKIATTTCHFCILVCFSGSPKRFFWFSACSLVSQVVLEAFGIVMNEMPGAFIYSHAWLTSRQLSGEFRSQGSAIPFPPFVNHFAKP